MPEARIESSPLKRTSSSKFGSSSETRSSIARRAIERLMRVRLSPRREREARITSCGGLPSRIRIAPRSAATASSSRPSTRSNSSSSGRCTTSWRAASLRIASTRFWRCSSAGSIAGLRVDRGQLAHREDTRALRLALVLFLLLGGRVRAEGERVLAQRDHVAGAQPPPLLDRLPVQQRAVLAAQVAHPVGVVALLDRRVVAREPLVRAGRCRSRASGRSSPAPSRADSARGCRRRSGWRSRAWSGERPILPRRHGRTR